MIKLIIALVLPLFACSTTSPQDLPNFHEVDAGVYRGGQPTALGMIGLQKKGIHTIIKLNKENLTEERIGAKQLGFKLVEIPLSGFFAPSNSDMDRIQKILNDPVLRPVFIHCEFGKDRTGISIALFRVFTDHWAPDKAHKEWMEFGHSPFLFPMDVYFKKKTKK